jgi:hypothetical protein
MTVVSGAGMETDIEALDKIEKAFELYMTKTQPSGFNFARAHASGRLDKAREAFYRDVAQEIILDSGTQQFWYDLISDSEKRIYQLDRVWQIHPECEESAVTKREVVTQTDSALSLYTEVFTLAEAGKLEAAPRAATMLF